MKPWSDTAEENKFVVLPVLEPWLSGVHSVLEIASGTGQQIVYFAQRFPDIVWQASELPEYLPGIRAWIEEAGLHNLQDPVSLDVADSDWPIQDIPFIYTSNSMHIMSWPHVEMFFAGAGRFLTNGGLVAMYGPFRFNGSHVSESNHQFDLYLQQRGEGGGVRDTADLTELGNQHGLSLLEAVSMPHNNHILIWQKNG